MAICCENRNLVNAYRLAIPFGCLGVHHFYLKRNLFGVLYLFTFGLLGIGWIVDLFRLPILLHRYHAKNDGSNKYKARKTKHLDDAYLLWFPLGFLGLHHFYLERPIWGVLYFFTGGLAGIGWIIDSIRLYFLVKNFNEVLTKDNQMV